MRKNLLSLSIAAMIGGLGLAGGAYAASSIPGAAANDLSVTNATTLAITPTGIGHIAVIPYFTTQNGNSTLINLINTDTVNGKALKVRFRSAANSDDIFDFTLFLSPGDVWAGSVTQDANGLSHLTTTDNSCTLPTSVNSSFVTDRLPSGFTAAQKAEWTREGYVEIFNMADVPPKLMLAGAANGAVNPLYTAIKHVNGVAPCTTSAFAGLINDVTDASTATAGSAGAVGFNTPSTGLAANAAIVNVANAYVSWAAPATSIVATTGGATPAAAFGRVVFSPQTGANATNPANFTSDPLLAGGFDAAGAATVATIPAAQFDFPDLSTPYTGTAVASNTAALAQADLVTRALAVTSISNEFLTDTTISAATDWTFSMPTRRYAVALNYATTPFSARFAEVGGDFFNSSNSTVSGNLVCVNPGSAAIAPYDRSERTNSAGFVISPGTVQTLSFCGEVSVLAFNGAAATTGVLGATVATKAISTGYTDGWVNIPTPGPTAGLPITGAAYVKATGPVVSGLATNFGLTNSHKFTR